MKEFMKRYSYSAVHLFITQVVIGLLGLMLYFAAGLADNIPLRTGTSVFAIIFFLFLEFAAAWRVGAEDRVSIESGKLKKSLLVPVKIWLLSCSLNFLLALFITLGNLLPDLGFFSTLGGIGAVIELFVQGMYMGVLALPVGGVQLNTLWYMHFLISLPALLAIFSAYACGIGNINFGGMFSMNANSKK